MSIQNVPLDVAFSPCPNDTYLFFAWQKGEVGCPIRPHLHDIEQLNCWLFKGKYDVSKASFTTALRCKDSYNILPVGAAFGLEGIGPLLLGKSPLKKVAIPGKGTVAHLLFQYFIGEGVEKVFTTFDRILPMIEANEVDGGVVIHETRFQYKEKGHDLLVDLGQKWFEKTHLPLPLGVLVAKKHLPVEKITSFLLDSSRYTKQNFDEAFPYILEHAQEMDREVLTKHIQTYVNEESFELSDRGIAAMEAMEALTHKLP